MVKFKEVRYLSVSIEREPEAVYAFASNPENLPQWASGLGQGVKHAGEHWEVQTQEGTVGLRFTPYNEYGVLDHTVVLSDGTEIYVPMRVMPNGKGSEVMLGLFRQPEMDDAAFARDAGLVQNDLRTLKALLEQQ
ncbi:MAG: SRPBCC family protein [Smithellaceae bacterium]